MDYKKEIANFLNEIQSEKFLKFLYNVIVLFNSQKATNKSENCICLVMIRFL